MYLFAIFAHHAYENDAITNPLLHKRIQLRLVAVWAVQHDFLGGSIITLPHMI
jgi:hypothetical protein